MSNASNLSPVLFIPHGGGPLPLLADLGHRQLIDFIQTLSSRIPTPEAICVISAHWEASVATITSGASPSLIYDYYDFPDKAYAIEYPVQGSPGLAQKLFAALQQNNIPARLDEQRGFDHGLFVPLKIMYPDAEIPCVQLSLLSSLDPAAHIDIGKALRRLRRENVLFFGSGFSFHNMRAFFTGNQGLNKQNVAFETWLVDTCTNQTFSFDERTSRLITWEQAPFARYCHPREEHLLPLLVCAGLSDDAAELVFDGEVLGKKTCGFIWH
ncbi:dioxygenase [Methylicorpusculum oleiharenae]|uniref:DODA-type extradiol aromatic ring-opening family dioxygenase n=1 Tax=Methylicorpusculum oleiharenae TaxID=1338687 RepID=UPI001358108E|nr:class III extradiol ring-cleavage dioxygenase [Methylicorpusculum oleiharenae]MCD2453424.1 dioxygenase [Methylicorpusculum oleiharenae]